METEEKLAWDGFELPTRNRQRMIEDFERQQERKRTDSAAEKKVAMREKEEGFTSRNGVVKEFARQKDSPAMFHTFHGHKQSVNAFKLSSDFNYFVSASSDCTVKVLPSLSLVPCLWRLLVALVAWISSFPCLTQTLVVLWLFHALLAI